MGAIKKERRASQRIKPRVLIKYKTVGGKAYRNVVACKNIGGKGVKLVLSRSVSIDSKIILTKKSAKTIETHCKIAWLKKGKDGKTIVGLEFAKIKNRNCFMNYICEEIINFSLKDKNPGKGS